MSGFSRTADDPPQGGHYTAERDVLAASYLGLQGAIDAEVMVSGEDKQAARVAAAFVGAGAIAAHRHWRRETDDRVPA